MSTPVASTVAPVDLTGASAGCEVRFADEEVVECGAEDGHVFEVIGVERAGQVNPITRG